jgi:isocitrate/isopropylmalate dehydrogenase
MPFCLELLVITICNELNSPRQGLLKKLRKSWSFANIRPIKPLQHLLNLLLWKKKIIEDWFCNFRELTGGLILVKKKINEQELSSDLCEYSEEEIIELAFSF